MMKKDKLIPIVIILGFIILFFFPEPQTNFLAYLGTALVFVFLVISLAKKKQR